jgi:predicted DsbA family dithiol-disulfide isomerase
MRERLFANASRLEPWDAHRAALGLSGSLIDECLASARNGLGIRQGMTDARGLSITGTPHFLIGRTERDGAGVRVVASFTGAKPIATFREVLDRVLTDGAAAAKGAER